MADTIKTREDLKFETLFVDGDTRTFTIKNPATVIQDSALAELDSYMQENNILIGDKYGGRFGKLAKVSRVEKTTVQIDLE